MDRNHILRLTQPKMVMVMMMTASNNVYLGGEVGELVRCV